MIQSISRHIIRVDGPASTHVAANGIKNGPHHSVMLCSKQRYANQVNKLTGKVLTIFNSYRSIRIQVRISWQLQIKVYESPDKQDMKRTFGNECKSMKNSY